MVKSSIVKLALFIHLILATLEQQKVEGKEWIQGGMSDMKMVKQTSDLLVKLEAIPSFDSTKLYDIIDLINMISVKIDFVSEQNNGNKQNRWDAVVNCVRNFIPIENLLVEFRQKLREVKTRYRKLLSITRNVNSFTNAEIKTFAESNLTPEHLSTSNHLSSLYMMYFGSDNNTQIPLVYQIALQFQHEHLRNVCPSISAQQHFYSDYLEFTILEIQGYLINKFSWTALFTLTGANFRGQETLFLQDHQERISNFTQTLRNVIKESTRELRRCDPTHWKENENYVRLTRLVQGYIVNEASLYEDFTCQYDCKQKIGGRISECYENDSFCDHDKKSTKVISCESETNSDYINICPSNDPARRYEYLDINRGYRNHKVLGKRGYCKLKESYIQSWTRGFYSCSYCFCLIDEKSEKSDRFFNLREVTSDVTENMVVTGIRFVKKNRIIYLQIQQGELAPFGLIKKDSAKWKEVEDYELNTRNEGVDFVTFDHSKNLINLDIIDIKNPRDIITGIKLTMVGSQLHLQVRLNEYNFETGKLINPENSDIWLYKTVKQRRVLVPLSEPGRGPKVSTLSPTKSAPSSPYYNMVELTHSDKTDDAAQTTLPFFDSQEVFSNSPTPLAGVGLYHKGFSGYGGFIAPKIYTIDFSFYV